MIDRSLVKNRKRISGHTTNKCKVRPTHTDVISRLHICPAISMLVLLRLAVVVLYILVLQARVVPEQQVVLSAEEDRYGVLRRFESRDLDVQEILKIAEVRPLISDLLNEAIDICATYIGPRPGYLASNTGSCRHLLPSIFIPPLQHNHICALLHQYPNPLSLLSLPLAIHPPPNKLDLPPSLRLPLPHLLPPPFRDRRVPICVGTGTPGVGEGCQGWD